MLGDFYDDFKKFRAVFTVKRVTVMLIVAAVILLLCGTHQENSSDSNDCGENSCPYPRHKAK